VSKSQNEIFKKKGRRRGDLEGVIGWVISKFRI